MDENAAGEFNFAGGVACGNLNRVGGDGGVDFEINIGCIVLPRLTASVWIEYPLTTRRTASGEHDGGDGDDGDTKTVSENFWEVNNHGMGPHVKVMLK